MDIWGAIQGKRYHKGDHKLQRVTRGRGRGSVSPRPFLPEFTFTCQLPSLRLGPLENTRTSSFQWTLSQKLLDPRSRDHKITIQVKSNGHPPFCFSPEIGSGSLAGLFKFYCRSGDRLTLNKMAFATANNHLG